MTLDTQGHEERDVSRWEEDSETILGSHRLSIVRRPGERVIIPRARGEAALAAHQG